MMDFVCVVSKVLHATSSLILTLQGVLGADVWMSVLDVWMSWMSKMSWSMSHRDVLTRTSID